MQLSAMWIMQYDATCLLHQNSCEQVRVKRSKRLTPLLKRAHTWLWTPLTRNAILRHTKEYHSINKNSSILVGLMYVSTGTAALERNEHHSEERSCVQLWPQIMLYVFWSEDIDSWSLDVNTNNKQPVGNWMKSMHENSTTDRTAASTQSSRVASACTRGFDKTDDHDAPL